MSTNQLRDELALLAGEVQWPPTPDVAATVAQWIEHGAHAPVPSRARLLARLRPAGTPTVATLRTVAAFAAALTLTGAVVPPARSAVLELLGITSGERIVRDKRPAAPTPKRRFELGSATSLAAARSAVDFALRVPAKLGAASETRISRRIPGGMVSLVYGDRVVLSQFRGGAVPYIAKLAGPRTRVQSVRVDGNAGFFISGAPPVVLLDDRNGHPAQMTPVLDGGSVLVWDRGRVAYRLESRGGLTQALTIARSLR